MSKFEISDLKNINSFESLVDYLKEKLYWPIEAEDAEDITFDYNPEDLGIEEQYVPKIKSIKQIRPLTDNQPWGLFYIDFETKKLPVVVLRRLLRALIFSSRKRDDRMKSWDLQDLIFISSLGEAEKRQVTFSHFSETSDGLPELKTFSWDAMDTHFHYAQNQIDLEKLRWPDDESDADAWREQWTSAFRLRHGEVIYTSQKLASAMAQLAIQIRDRVKEVFEYETKNGPLHKLFDNFERVLIHDLTIDSFADMYAQTITYGLFSAKASHESDFEVENITAMIPNTNPFLRSLFEECTRLGNSDSENLDIVELGVSELISLLKDSNIEPVLQDFGRQKKSEDPVIHFYEDFLKEYDSHQRIKRGVFYTPDPVVSFIVRSVDNILRADFDCYDGLADTSTVKIKYKRRSKRGNNLVEDTKEVPKVQVLDPATGTGTFLKYVIKEIKKTFDENNKELSRDELKEKWNEYVPKHLLPRIFGFELMAAPYAVAHLKLGLELAETGYNFKSDKRLGIYLTNTLEGTHEGAGTLDAYLNWLAEEGHKANVIKAKYPISVILGNPPYANYGMLNKGVWILKLLNDYKKGLNERKINIDDDYIKFLRFSHSMIEKVGFGIIGMITNNSYLDGITHRVMRKSLFETFDEIYILNLHGNSNRGEIDDNIFDIKIGVSIAFFIKYNMSIPNNEKKIYYYSTLDNGLMTRKEKYAFLLNHHIRDLSWEILEPESPNYWFINKDLSSQNEYDNGYLLTDIFEEYNSGIQSGKNHLATDYNKNNLKRRIQEVLNAPEKNLNIIRNKFDLKDTSGWNLSRFRKAKFSENKIVKFHYRPFDIRWIFYDKFALKRDRQSIMQYFFENENIGLVFVRQATNLEWNHIFVSTELIDLDPISATSRGSSYIAPLYLNPKNKTKPNFSLNFNRFITTKYKSNPNAEDILGYIYAILHSITYRKKYSELLKIDFPRIPFSTDDGLFNKLSELGSKLIKLHLLQSDKIYNNFISLNGEGNYDVGTIGNNNFEDGRLYINKSQYFDGIPEEVYNFQIGGYQVCKKWLKERKGQTLTEEEIEHYQKIVVAIDETIRIMKEIDEVIEEHGGWPIK